MQSNLFTIKEIIEVEIKKDRSSSGFLLVSRVMVVVLA
jgi:hypothetical protein